jgi:hypothetical protein
MPSGIVSPGGRLAHAVSLVRSSRRQEVRLAATTLAGPHLAIRPETIGTTRSDARGRFGLSWRPRKRTYVITATVPDSAAPYRPDKGCDLTLTAR